ncbi:MAG: hypothetical protein HY608_03890, partial [Planctomycetes bacterium]|nr:hypothetical protein [Planctomycetota bacterium]
GPFGGAANQLAIEREWEREVAAKVREAFGYIEDPVYVVADLQLRPVDLAREEVGAPAGEPASDVALPLQHTSEHTETSTAAAPPPTGVSGNLATNLAASAPGMNTSIATTESEVTGYQMIRTVKIQEREVRIAVVDSSISVTVPWLRKKGADGVLTYEDPSPLFAEYQGKIGRATGIVDAKIHLSAYQPEPPPLPEGFVSQAGTLLVENFGTVALTCLALVALGVLGSLARHAFAPLASEAALAPPGGAIVEKGEERPVDDREARVQQVVDRDPALAAGLVKRWLSGA